MRSIFPGLILVGTLVIGSQAQASNDVSLDELLLQADPTITLENLRVNNQDNAKNLCLQILEPGFYKKVEELKIGVFKRNKIIAFCENIKYDAPEKEIGKIDIFELEKKADSFQGERKALLTAQKKITENAKVLAQKPEMKKIQERIEVAAKQLDEANEYYDNLTVAISLIREDIKEIQGFKVFKPNAHDDDTPEQYLQALNQALPQENPGLIVRESLDQIEAASELLRQANENLAKARLDLEAINREMLELAK